jgi:hypothetical protein
LLFSSSGRTVRNSNRIGTVSGFLPNESIMNWTALVHDGNCNARPAIAKHNWTMTALDPVWCRCNAAMSVSRKLGKLAASTWCRS